MKHLKLFEDFKNQTPARANDLLKEIEKTIKYNLEFGALSKEYIYESSDIFDDNGPNDWLKIELYKKKDEAVCRYHIMIMVDEEEMAKSENQEISKVHLEIQKYKLPEYKKVTNVKETVELVELLKDDFLVKKIDSVDETVLKVPSDKKSYDQNLKGQIDNLKNLY